MHGWWDELWEWFGDEVQDMEGFWIQSMALLFGREETEKDVRQQGARALINLKDGVLNVEILAMQLR